MKTINWFLPKLLFCLIFYTGSIYPLLQSTAFTTAPGVGAFHQPTGLFVLGAGSTGAGDQALATVGPAGKTAPTITSIGDGANISGKKIGDIALSQKSGSAVTTATTRAVVFDSNANTLVNVVNLNGSNYTAGSALNDAGGSSTTAGILALAATSGLAEPNYIFATVIANGQSDFGAGASGIAVVALDDDNTMTIHDADAGASGNNAYQLGTNSAELDLGGTAGTMTTDSTVLHWCKNLNRLYFGTSYTSNGATDHACAVACYKYTAGAGLENVKLNEALAGYGTAADLGAVDGTGSNIVAAAAASVTMGAVKLGTMLTSTGKNYLIIAGGKLTTAGQANKVFAVPLVGSGDDTGALAQVTLTSDITTIEPVVDFSTRADGTNELLTEAHVAAKVGGGALPLAASANSIQDMQVVGDTVFVGTFIAAGSIDTSNEPGIYYSQAIFNDAGVIVKWTDWAKAVPNQVSGDSVTDGGTRLFAVDATRGKMWSFSKTTGTIAQLTTWTKATDTTTYGGQVNTKLNNGTCYSFLNLGQYIKNFGNESEHRYCLFGGKGKIVAIRTGTVPSPASYTAVETPTTDWDAATNAAVVLQRGDMGSSEPVQALGYLFHEADASSALKDNFLLAGTTIGLYYFVDSSNEGFDIRTTLNASDNGTMNGASSIWQTYSWKKSSLVKGPVAKIVSTSGSESNNASAVALVLTREPTNKVWLVSSGTSTSMIDKGKSDLDSSSNTRVIATAGQGDFAGVNSFYDIALIAEDGSTENFHHLLIATDKGTYISTRAWGVYHLTTAANADFVKIDATKVKGLATPQRVRGSQHFWTVDRGTGKITQWGVSATDAATRTKTPLDGFNASAGFTKITGLDNPFYSNGALRLISAQTNVFTPIKTYFFNLNDSQGHHEFRRASTHVIAYEDEFEILINDTTNTATITIGETTDLVPTPVVLPYQVGVTDANISSYVALDDISNITYWTGDAGAGYLMVGTTAGVISLE